MIIPVYNGERFLAETLDSLANQSERIDEIIVVDDGSTDSSREIAQSHPAVTRLVEQPNRGVAVARNRGALEATGTWVTFLDQDDLWLPHRAARLARFVQSDPTARVFVTTAEAFFDPVHETTLRNLGEQMHRISTRASSSELLAASAIDDGRVPQRLENLSTTRLLAGPVSVTTTYFWRRDLFLSVGGCHVLARSHDDHMALVATSLHSEVRMVDEPSLLYRLHPGNTTHTTDWNRPLLASLLAAQLGGQLRQRGDLLPELADASGFRIARLRELAATEHGVADALAFVRLLAPSRSDRRWAYRRILRAWLRSRWTRSRRASG